MARNWKFLGAILLAGALSTFAADDAAIVVHGPTVVAFFAPVKHPETEADELRAMQQFQASAKKVREPLEKAGIELHEVYAVSFQLRIGDKVITFDSGHMKVGYYFIVPGKDPRIEYGVASPAQILDVAHQYFGR